MNGLAPAVVQRGSRLAGRLLDLVLPPRCLACGVTVDRQGSLCGRCWQEVLFITPPFCRQCGYPLPHSAVPDPLCAACLAEPPSFARMRSALRYEGAGRRLILRFKHAERIEGVATFARWMAEAGDDVLAEADILAPVPLHRWRLLGRGYNQSALLARAVARLAGRPCVPDLLERHRATASQQRLGARARRENVTPAAFRPHRRHRQRIAEARILLVDDVFTTGATLEACAKVLLRAGAARVDALTLARVVRNEAHPI